MFAKMPNFFTTLLFCGAVVFVSGKNVDLLVRSKRTTIQDNSANCNQVKTFFHHLNITIDPANNRIKGSVCGGECCTDQTENQLRKESQKDFAALLRHKTRTVQGMLTNTGATLHSQVMDLSSQSENKTRLLFSQVYKGMAVLSSSPISTLYTDIRNFITFSTAIAQSTEQPQQQNLNIRQSVGDFFRDLFPLVFYQMLFNSNDNKDFTNDYKLCLKKTQETILPFGDVPQQIAESLEKSLQATRLLLQAFTIGAEVLNATDKLLIEENGKSNYECHNALLKMTYCPRCNGWNARPCSGYCLNVLRGCLTKYVAELDSPWNSYVEGVESLINAMKKSNIEMGLNVDLVFRLLDSKISDALMRAMQNARDILEKVKRHCGTADMSSSIHSMRSEEAATTTPLPPSSLKPTRSAVRSSTISYETKILRFLADFVKTRGFYGNLADSLCKDETFAELKDQRCWNGERIAEYTKTVVDVGYDMQKYNPEVKPMTNTQTLDSRIATLVDKLQRVHHMAIASSGIDADYMQRDGVEGSGSGYGQDMDDPEDDYSRGSGSGHGEIEESGREASPKDKVPPKSKTPSISSTPTGSANRAICGSLTSVLFAVIVTVMVRIYY